MVEWLMQHTMQEETFSSGSAEKLVITMIRESAIKPWIKKKMHTEQMLITKTSLSILHV